MKQKLLYHFGKLSEKEEWELDFKDSLSRSVYERIELGFIPLRLPVIDEAPYRIFDKMKDYYSWAKKNLPKYLGYF